MANNLSRQYCAYFGDATEVWKRYVIGEIIEAFDEYRDSVCQTLQDADNSGPNASTSGGQDVNNQEEMLVVVLENAQQQAEQRIVSALNQTLYQPTPVSLSPVVSIIANQSARVNPPGENAISQGGFNSGQNDVSIKSEVDSSSESECESDTDDDEVQVKEEPNEEEESITGSSGEQTDNDNSNSADNREINNVQNDNSNDAANEPNAQAMIIDGEESNLEEHPNGSIIIVVPYSSPPSSPLNAEQSINSSEFNSNLYPDNQITMTENIASDDPVGAADYGHGNMEEDERIDNMETEESDLYDRQESDNERSMIDEENEEEEDSLMNDEDSTDDTTDDEELAAGPSTSTGRRSTRQVSKRQSVPDRQAKQPIKVKKTEPMRIITKKLKCTVPGCKKVVKNKSALNSHLLSAHKLKRYRCLVRRCYGKVSTSFTTRVQLNDHRDHVHSHTTRWTCHCSKKFKSYKDLCTHYRSYHELGLFACSKDGCVFKPKRTRIKVQHHQHNHLEAKFECPVDGCDRSFKKKDHLDRHTLTHSGERPFPCPECDKSFNRKDHLAAHLRVHRNDKCYRCTWRQCTHSASVRSNVLRHIRTVHFELPATKKQQAEEEMDDARDARDYLAKD